ncbi:MAG TPA: flagellar basal-body MS-ring/collar protein FliF [Anaeromyxobacteraceae bacterium]|nr:flagellar basal-body MS-ring/collar protein FliF [Anaeromyxobacteraceae bacterium]
MEPLAKQLRELPSHFGALPGAAKALLLVLALAIGAAGVVLSLGSSEGWQYAFTNLTAEDSSEAAATLKAAGVPFRLEAGGSALAVPAGKVYDARLLLAGAGLPRGGGVGFELFDRGDLGVSEFTQRINLRRAIEGELARTISRLGPVRSARLHISLAEKGLFRDDDRKASAAVVLNLQPGRILEDREVAGIRHLVASAVPGLAAEGVTVVDGKGNVLSSETPWGEANAYERKLERDLERRVVELLEQAVGKGAVVARVTAQVDSAEVSKSAETVDPDATALRSERHVAQTQSQDAAAPSGVAGAAANQPLQAQAAAPGSVNRGASSLQDEIRNYDVSRTTTTTVERAPRLKRISVAVLLDGVGGKPRPDAEVAQLGELAKRAVGFDTQRGDEMDISSAPFARAEEPAETARPAAAASKLPVSWLIAAGAGLLALLVVIFALSGSRRRAPLVVNGPQLVPGTRISELEARFSAPAGALPPGDGDAEAPKDPREALREKAKALAAKDPARAALILKSWMSEGAPHA